MGANCIWTCARERIAGEGAAQTDPYLARCVPKQSDRTFV